MRHIQGLCQTRYWRALDDGRVECTLCPRQCQLRDGKRGLCYVRMAMDGEIVLTDYGYTSGFFIDPIEKKPLFHFLPGSAVLSFGGVGCNLTCQFCQNWSISKRRDDAGLTPRVSPEAIASAARLQDCPSVAFTYNDPVIYLEFARDVAAACHAQGVKTVAVTAGYIQPEPAVEFFSGMDAVNVDLKAFSEPFYRTICGGHLAPVLDTLKYLHQHTSVWLEMTTLLIPGENDSEAEIRQLSDWIGRELGADVPLHFTAFHPDFHMPDHSPTSVQTLLQARSWAKQTGLNHVYTGNRETPEAESSWCPQCGALLIERAQYRLGRWGLQDGTCLACGYRLPGVFDAAPGQWGPRRRPISVG